MTYDDSEIMAHNLTLHLIKIYFEGVDRKKVTPEESLGACFSFVKQMWDILVSKIIKENKCTKKTKTKTKKAKKTKLAKNPKKKAIGRIGKS